MSIIDNDSTSSTRNSPTINVNDDKGIRRAHNTYGNTLRRAGSAVKQFMRFAQGIIEAKDADDNRSFFMGYEPEISARPVIRIAKDGSDALTGGDDELVFNSENNVFKIVKSGTIPQTVSSLAQDATDTLTISHGLSFRPAIIAFVDGTGSNYLSTGKNYSVPLSVPVKVGATYYPGVIYSFNVDSNNIYFTIENRSAATPITDIGTTNWKYYVLQETAN